jgi:putative membrane protein
MEHALNADERKRLDLRIAEAENRTGAQIVLAVIQRSDAYHELPWKAFAMGASLAALAVFISNILPSPSSPLISALSIIVTILAAGGCFAISCVFIPAFARLFLSRHRAEAETKQYAESLFLSRQLFATKDRRAVLVLVSLFERRIVVLPDTGLVDQLDPGTTNLIIDAMRPLLKAGRIAQALETGLEKLEEMIRLDGKPQSPDSQLSNGIIEEQGT